MTTLQIKLDDLLDFKNDKLTEDFIYSSYFLRKKLTFNLSGNFKVYHKDTIKYDGQSSTEAVDVYNSII
jgi:hypothetical protein